MLSSSDLTGVPVGVAVADVQALLPVGAGDEANVSVLLLLPTPRAAANCCASKALTRLRGRLSISPRSRACVMFYLALGNEDYCKQ
jgi:hypothetical protein